MSVVAGNTFILTRATGSTPHLWIVLTAPAGEPPEVVIVSLTTLRPHSDETVVLHPGDHPFVQHPTCVYFSDARIVAVAQLEKALRQGQAVPRADVSPELLRRIREGLLESPWTVHRIRRYCKAIFEAEEGDGR